MTEKKSPITTHILDTSRGRPAEGVHVGLFRIVEGVESEIASGVTNADGRINTWMAALALEQSDYTIRFELADYFRRHKTSAFYPQVEVHFRVDRVDEHYHVPLLLNPFGYATYRGS